MRQVTSAGGCAGAHRECCLHPLPHDGELGMVLGVLQQIKSQPEVLLNITWPCIVNVRTCTLHSSWHAITDRSAADWLCCPDSQHTGFS